VRAALGDARFALGAAIPALLLMGWGVPWPSASAPSTMRAIAPPSPARSLNDRWWGLVGGVLRLYNAGFYCRYNQWHHRYNPTSPGWILSSRGTP